MRCLGLDLGMHVGWALFAKPDGMPKLGTYELRETRPLHFGPRFLDLEQWLDRKVADLAPQLIAFEAPLVPIDGKSWAVATDAATVYFLIGLAAIVELVAARHQVRCLTVAVSTVKTRMTGDQWAKKRAVVAAAVAAGYRIADSHQADACGVALAAFDHVGAS